MSSASTDDFASKPDCYTSLLKGLEINTVLAEDDGHPLAVYTIASNDDKDAIQQKRRPVLLLHGRTWSSVPVYHLAGGRQDNGSDGNDEAAESRSLIEALFNTGSIQPYAMDFRGFGGTPKDNSGFVEPLRCIKDAISVLNWIQSNEIEKGTESDASRPALLGWSHGALIAQIAAQRYPDAMSKLILYGSIYNPNVKYSIPPPPFPGDDYKNLTDHDDFPLHEMAPQNVYGNATEDFTHNHVVSNWFAEAALICDPIKVQWWNLHQLNECHPSLVKVPTMVIAGDQDPYAPMSTQAELFTHLGKGRDRVWSIIANADHAVHLSDRRFKLVENVRNFIDTHSG
jgi:pimeloyl-ACP methyl ester carboxylesterase